MSHCLDDEEIISDKKRKKHILDTDDEDDTETKVFHNDSNKQSSSSSDEIIENEPIQKIKRKRIKSKKHATNTEDELSEHENLDENSKHVRKKKKRSKTEMEAKDVQQSLLTDNDFESNLNEEIKPKERKKHKKLDPMFEIRRESQRMIRENRISLPYHNPKSRSLSEFLQRIKSIQTSSIPIKPTTHDLKRVWTIMEKRNEELKTFYKSESDDSDNECKKDTSNQQTGDDNVEIDKKQVEKENEVLENVENKENISENTENEKNMEKISKSTVNKENILENTKNGENEEMISENTENKEKISEDTENEENQPKISENVENEEHISENKENERKIDEPESEKKDVNSIKNEKREEGNDTNCEKNEDEEILIENVDKQEEGKNSFNNKMKLISSIWDLGTSENEKLENVEKWKFKKYETIVKERFPTLDLNLKTPSLDGNAEDVVHFETETICNSGLVNLMERFMKHTAVKTETQHDKTLHISTVGSTRDDCGEIISLNKETFTIVEKSQQNEYSKLVKPGAKLAYFKNEIKKTMTMKKESQWKESCQEEEQDEENCTKELNTSFSDKEEEMDDFATIEDDDEEGLEEEEEEMEEDVIIKDSKRKRNEFIDEEAEESDEVDDQDEDEDGEGKENEKEKSWAFSNISSSQLERKVCNFDEEEDDDGDDKLDEMYSVLGDDSENTPLSPSTNFTSSENSLLKNYGMTYSQIMNETQELKETKNIPECETNDEKNKVNDSDDEDFQWNVRKKVKVMILSDEESEDEEENYENQENDKEEEIDEESLLSNDEEVDYEDNIGYDSEEEIVDTTKVQQFFENEAELSESEWGSDDENEKGMDELEEEAGDKDNIDEQQVKEQLGKIHMRQLMDDDQKDVKLLQEMLLEDGELHSDTKRQRKFQWKNIDDGDYGLEKSDNSDNEGNDDEDEVDENWRKIRHERETFLREQAKNINYSTGDDDYIENEKDAESATNNAIRDITFSPNAKQPFQIRCGSFLSRGNNILSKIAATIGPEKEFATDAPRNGGNFVFSVKSPDVPSKTEKRRVVLLSKVSDRISKISKCTSSSILEKLEL